MCHLRSITSISGLPTRSSSKVTCFHRWPMAQERCGSDTEVPKFIRNLGFAFLFVIPPLRPVDRSVVLHVPGQTCTCVREAGRPAKWALLLAESGNTLCFGSQLWSSLFALGTLRWPSLGLRVRTVIGLGVALGHMDEDEARQMAVRCLGHTQHEEVVSAVVFVLCFHCQADVCPFLLHNKDAEGSIPSLAACRRKASSSVLAVDMLSHFLVLNPPQAQLYSALVRPLFASPHTSFPFTHFYSCLLFTFSK